MTDDLKTKVQSQFGASAKAYATSNVHAKGKSLQLLVDLIQPQPYWRMLDVATGAGHTALTFAPHVAEVIACDLTEEMLEQTAKLAKKRGLENLETRQADAEALPFDDNSFDILTCRLAFHHFPNPQKALKEFRRVLKQGGKLGFTDNVTVINKEAAKYYNQYEKLRDPSHFWVPSLEELSQRFEQAGFRFEATRSITKEFEFHTWADRQHVSSEDKDRLLEMMRQIPSALEPLFQPRWTANTMYFSLWEIVIIAQ